MNEYTQDQWIMLTDLRHKRAAVMNLVSEIDRLISDMEHNSIKVGGYFNVEGIKAILSIDLSTKGF